MPASLLYSRIRLSAFRLCLAAGLMAATAAGAADGVNRNSLVLGQSIALTGPGSTIALPFYQGAKLYFDRINADGGVGGRRIDLVAMDDRGNAKLAVDNTRKLLDQGVLALFGYYGSAQVEASYALIKESDTLLFAPMAAADELRSQNYMNVYSLRPGYAEEAAAITRHAEVLGARRLAILHDTDSESLAALDSADRTMSGLGADLVAKVAFAPGAVAKVGLAKPQSVLLIGDAARSAAAVRQLRGAGFRGPVYGFSNAGEGLLATQLGAVGAGVVVVRVVPRSDSLKIPVVRDLTSEAQVAGLGRPNVHMMEGYLAARVFVEALHRIGRAEPTRARLKKALDGLTNLDVGGFRADFGGERVASKMVELSLIDANGRVRE